MTEKIFAYPKSVALEELRKMFEDWLVWYLEQDIEFWNYHWQDDEGEFKTKYLKLCEIAGVDPDDLPVHITCDVTIEGQ